MNKATKRLIGSVWTLTYEIVSDNQIKIISYNRDDDEGYDKERELPLLSLIESEKRIVEKVVLMPYKPLTYCAKLDDPAAKVYEVVNPQYIFSYS